MRHLGAEQLVLDFDRAKALRDKGMAAATDHADADSPSWSDRALAFYHQMAISKQYFSTEDVRIFAHNNGLPTPPDGRAWGSIPRRAAHKGWIRKAGKGVARDPKVHMNEVQIWESLIWG